MTDLATYLAGLKAGDVVHIRHHWSVVTETVERVTQTQIVAGGRKFWRTHRYGFFLGNRTDGKGAANIITPENAAEREAENRRKTILHECGVTLDQSLTLDTIPAMRAALDRAEAALREGE